MRQGNTILLLSIIPVLVHIGHAYTSTIADSIARWHRFNGKDVLFLTGLTSTGRKIERIATPWG